MSAIRDRFRAGLEAGGLTNPAGLAAALATAQRESRFSAKNAFGSWNDPSERGVPGISGGLMSWRGLRFRAMRQFAADNGDDPDAPQPETQAAFFLNENPGLIDTLNSAPDPDTAMDAMNRNWQFAGFDRDSPERNARFQEARSFYSGLTGGEMPSASGGGDTTLAGSAGDDRLGTEVPMPSGFGGLGGLGGMRRDDSQNSGIGGFFRSDEFGDMLSDIGMSIATSPRNNWLANLPEIQATNGARRDKRREDADERAGIASLLMQYGLSQEEAQQYARNPKAAELLIAKRQADATKASNQQFQSQLVDAFGSGSSGGYDPMSYSGGVDPSTLPRLPTSGPLAGRSAATRSAMFAPDPLGTTMPDRSGASDVIPVMGGAPSGGMPSMPGSRGTAPGENKTLAHLDKLRNQARQLGQVAMLAETDDQRASAKVALDQLNGEIDYYQKWADKHDAANAPTDDIKEWREAQRGGYAGSLPEWMRDSRAGAKGGEPTYSTAPVYARDATGNIVITQLGDNATAKTTEMPDGLTPMGPYDTSFDRSRGTTAGKNLADSQSALPGAQTIASQISSQVDSLKNDPYLPSMVGAIDSRLPNWSGNAARVQSKMDQLKGGAFLQGRQLLKGSGPITDFESKRAEAAFIRMNEAQSEADYIAGLDEFNDAVQTGVAKLEQQARGGAPAASPAPAAGSAGGADPLGLR